MRAVYYDTFKGPLTVETVPDPVAPEDGVVVQLNASGICRSDWYGWQGHDSDIRLPHVPGHELAGIVLETGAHVRHWKPGDRVTTPFVSGCGECHYCIDGNTQVCPDQTQPGFTHWGSFAEYVVIRNADVNLVRLPPEMEMIDAAVLGCRFGTSYRAIISQGQLKAEETVVIFGCGGVGLSAVQISSALGARVIAVDIDDQKLAKAQDLGADHIFNSKVSTDIIAQVVALTHGGAHLSIDAIGKAQLVSDGIQTLRRQGRHVQVGLMEGADIQSVVPMDRVIARELHLLGSHGIQAAAYDEIFGFIAAHKLDLRALLDRTVSLSEAAGILSEMSSNPPTGICVIDQF